MMRVLAAVLAFSIGGCAANDPGPPTFGTGLGTPDSPIPHAASYTLQSKINMSAEQTKIDAAVAGMRAFAVNPAGTILAKAQEAGEPALADLDAALSTTLKNQLEGWMNAQIATVRIASKTPQQYATDVAAMAGAALSQITVESSLSIAPSAVIHTLTGLNFRPGGLDVVVPMGGLVADSLIQHPTATVGSGGALTLGDEHFGIAYGDHAWQGLNLAATTLYGSDFHTTLDSALACGTLAQVVSTKCINASCVGHAADLRAICETGIATLIDELRDDVRGFTLDTLRFMQGTATLVDDNANGEADRIVNGTWTAEVDLGAGAHSVAATFLAEN